MSAMGINISQQLTLFAQSILLGMAVALVYDLLRPFRIRLPRLTALLDVLFCLVLSVSVFLFMLRRAQGSCGVMFCWARWAGLSCISRFFPPCCVLCGIFGAPAFYFCCIFSGSRC